MKAKFLGILAIAAVLPLASCRKSERIVRHENTVRLALSWASYVDQEHHLPQNGKLSWRVELLKGTALYKRFHMDDSWDSPHNQALIKEIPLYYQDPSPNAKKGDTCYLAITGEGCALNGNRAVKEPKGVEVVVAVITANKSVPWTKPEDVPLKEVEESIRWDNGATEGIGWEGTPIGWQKVYPPGTSAYKPFFSLGEGVIHHRNCTFHAGWFGKYIKGEGHLPQNSKLSWRVEALRDSGDPMARNLYARFHKDESWDSPHNRALIGEIPSYFQDPSAAAKKGETCYLGVAGEDCAFNGKEVKPLPQGSWTVIAVITAKKSVPWTKPEDVPLKEVEASIRWGDDGTHGIAWNGYYTGWGKVPTPGRPETIARFSAK